MVRGDRALLSGGARWPVGDLRDGTAVATLRPDDRSGERRLARVDGRRCATAPFEPSGVLARVGTVGGATGWYADSGGHLSPLSIPPAALPRWSPDGSRLAYFTPGQAMIALGTSTALAVVPIDGAVNGLSWTPAR